MMSKKILLAIATAAGFAAGATTAVAAPLPPGTILKITPGNNVPGLAPCTAGSCFGMFAFAPNFYSWTAIYPGIDGGIVVGKAQASGGQEVDRLSSSDGQLSAMWNTFKGNGTFFTDQASLTATPNIFDDTSCSGTACFGKTELKVLNVAWGGYVIPMGSALGCTLTTQCSADEKAGIFVKTWTVTPVAGSTTLEGAAWSMTYNQVVPTVFPDYPFELILAGTIQLPPVQNVTPVVTVTPVNATGETGKPVTFTITVTDPDGAAPTCRVVTAPVNGTVVLNGTGGCAGGTYTSAVDFVGTDMFTVAAHDTHTESTPATTVNVAVIAGPTSTSTFTSTSTPTNTSTNSPTSTSTNTATSTSTPSNTSTSTFTNTPTNTTPIGVSPSPTATHTATNTPTRTSTSTSTSTPTSTSTNSPTNTVVIVPTPTPTSISNVCTDRYPLKQISVTGKRGNVTVVFSGNIVSSSNKTIKICPTTRLSYSATTNKAGASIKCKVRHNRTTGTGTMRANDELNCSDKPIGNDKVEMKAKSGGK